MAKVNGIKIGVFKHFSLKIRDSETNGVTKTLNPVLFQVS
jgi:hypothetical protein